MQKLVTPFKALLTLGWLGLIILLMAGMIEFASFSQGSYPFDTEMEKMSALTALEGEIATRLGSMQTAESFYVYAREFGLESEQYRADALAEDAAISASLIEMAELGYFTPAEDEFYQDEAGASSTLEGLIGEFNDLRAAHRATFDQIAAAYDAQDPDAAFELAETAADQNDEMDYILEEAVDWLEEERLAAASEFPADANTGVQMAAVGFAAVIVLAILGYQRISATTRPLRDLANAVTAIAGDQYRADLLGDTLKKGGPAGKLARALNDLASGLQQRDSGGKAQIETLRQQLYESRRRRLKVNRADEQGGRS